MTVETPHSQTDPYSPEPSNTEPVRALLISFGDKPNVSLECDARVMDNHTLIKHGERLYAYRCTDERDGRWVRVYRECAVVVL